MTESPPERSAAHDRLDVFLGQWTAEGEAYGSGTAESWTSSHTARWHTGRFFLIQDERALTGGKPFDTLGIMGVDPETHRYFIRSFENHGFYRHYDIANEGRVWTFSGELERARIEVSGDGRTQMITWEWKPKGRWVPLCDRVARRVD